MSQTLLNLSFLSLERVDNETYLIGLSLGIKEIIYVNRLVYDRSLKPCTVFPFLSLGRLNFAQEEADT